MPNAAATNNRRPGVLRRARRDHGPVAAASYRLRRASWQRQEWRTTLWLVPTLLVAASVGLFLITLALDIAAQHHDLSYPSWIRTVSADSGRQVLIAIAAAVITTVGVVFSVTILALTLASQQFGPRMMRNFIRDVGNQVTLGVWVATFVYAVLALGLITSGTGPFGNLVPHLTITIAEGLLFVDVAVLIYFIHHIAKSIQLPEVIAGIARDLLEAVDSEYPVVADEDGELPVSSADEVAELIEQVDRGGVNVPALDSGYLQFVAFSQLVRIAEETGAVIHLAHRPGHFVVAGRPLGKVWPPTAAPAVERALEKSHVTGPHRTLIQDPVFAIDQMVEIAIRALSAAVNDTFTALTCIDWLSAGLARISGRVLSEGVYRDRGGQIRLVELAPSYERMVNRAFDKIRQAGGHMPAVIIRLVDAIAHVIEYTVHPEQRAVLLRQADMILRSADLSVAEPNDVADIHGRYDQLVAMIAARDARSALSRPGTAPRLAEGLPGAR